MPTRRILGVDFFVGGLDEAVDLALHKGGLIVAPSAPGLAVDLVKAPSYREALTTADLAITDSGFMVLLWRLYTAERLPRHSGLKFIRAILERPELKTPGAVFWVMPSAEEDVRNRDWLRAQGFPVTEADVYIAPHYPVGPIHDDELVRRVRAANPRVVMLAIGGGVQERVGVMLRRELAHGGAESKCAKRPETGVRPETKPETGNLKPEGTEFDADDPVSSEFQVSGFKSQVSNRRPAILCLGAAIAFLTGGQVAIPVWADRLILGWLFRLLSSPRKYWRRYWDALALARLLWKNRERLPDHKG